ncbi:hypothetical protein PJI17_30880, partial [Mycobacterium kansasii]
SCGSFQSLIQVIFGTFSKMSLQNGLTVGVQHKHHIYGKRYNALKMILMSHEVELCGPHRDAIRKSTSSTRCTIPLWAWSAQNQVNP